MRAFLLAQRVGRLRLDRVATTVELLALGQRRKQKGRAEAGREPGEHPRAATRPGLGAPVAELLELVGPARGVAPLGGGEAAIDAREALFALRGRHRVVEGGAVDLVAVVAPQTLDALAGHGATRGRVAPPRRTASPPPRVRPCAAARARGMPPRARRARRRRRPARSAAGRSRASRGRAGRAPRTRRRGSGRVADGEERLAAGLAVELRHGLLELCGGAVVQLVVVGDAAHRHALLRRRVVGERPEGADHAQSRAARGGDAVGGRERALRGDRPVVAAPDDRRLMGRAVRVALRRDRDRARRAVQEPLGGAAGEDATGAAGVRRTDDDQAGVLLLRERVEPMGGRGVRDRLDLDGLVSLCAAEPLEHLDAVFAQVGLELVVDRAARVHVVGEDVDEHELGAGHAGQAARQCDGIGRAG